VAIVGAGPAGSSAATALARSGAEVVLIERESFPRYKTCGGGVVSRALQFLPSGFALPLERACLNVEMHFGPDGHGGRAFRVKREQPIVAMVMRAEFDRALADEAVQAGATLIGACEVLGLEHGADAVALTTTSGAIRARMIIGADGARG
jgi:flavin-dependent dehydrogenase